MPIVHVVLFRLKPGVTAEQKKEIAARIRGMEGRIPGLREIRSGAPMELSAHRAHGFGMGLVAVFETVDDLKVYATHPVHKEMQSFGFQFMEDMLAYDIES